ncbi:MAG: PilN domain-containing protein [Planctomycetes bacterium]|nr:PilN domain-containing protein [Planctomycetota bacterium]
MENKNSKTIITSEIDFLPQWYKSGRRKSISYRVQYIAIGCVFMLMLIWNFYAVAKIANAQKKVEENVLIINAQLPISDEFAKLQSEKTNLQRMADVLGKIDSKIDVSAVLAEMSFLTNEEIILDKIEFNADGFGLPKASGKSKRFKASNSKTKFQNEKIFGDVRFKILISGVGQQTCDVARFVTKLEDSPYFCLVEPSFSQTKKTKTVAGFSKPNSRLNGFQIACYLANYQDVSNGFAKK